MLQVLRFLNDKTIVPQRAETQNSIRRAFIFSCWFGNLIFLHTCQTKSPIILFSLILSFQAVFADFLYPAVDLSGCFDY